MKKHVIEYHGGCGVAVCSNQGNGSLRSLFKLSLEKMRKHYEMACRLCSARKGY